MSLVDVLISRDEGAVPSCEGILERLHQRYPLNAMLLSGRYEQLLARAEGRSERVRLKRAAKAVRETGLASEVRIGSRCSRSGDIYQLRVVIDSPDKASLCELVQGLMQDEGLPVAVDVHGKLVLLGAQAKYLHGETGLNRDQLGWECLDVRNSYYFQDEEWMTTETVAQWADISLHFTDMDILGQWIHSGHGLDEVRQWVEVHEQLHRYWLVEEWKAKGFSAEQVSEWTQVHPRLHDPHVVQRWRASGLDLDDARQASDWFGLDFDRVSFVQIGQLATYKRQHGTLRGFSGTLPAV